MARDLGDVIDAFIPQAARGQPRAESPEPASEAPNSLSIGLPVARGDVLRAAVAWNLSVEISRTGAPCTLVTHSHAQEASLWPPPGRGPLGSRLVHAEAPAAATEMARGTAARIVLDCPPAEALAEAAAAPGAPQRWLLLSSPDPDELRAVHAQAIAIARIQPEARIGATIHGVRRIAEAQAAFEELSVALERDAAVALESYGLLVDDLHLYRAIVAQRPIGLAHPAAPATRALADVAKLLLEDAETER